MRFLANENFPLASALYLRNAGHNVAVVIQDSPGAKDRQLLAHAAAERRIVLTFDRDCGELIFRLRLPTPEGGMYFRYDPLDPEEPARHLLLLLEITGLQLSGRFTVVRRDMIRQRPLP